MKCEICFVSQRLNTSPQRELHAQSFNYFLVHFKTRLLAHILHVVYVCRVYQQLQSFLRQTNNQRLIRSRGLIQVNRRLSFSHVHYKIDPAHMRDGLIKEKPPLASYPQNNHRFTASRAVCPHMIARSTGRNSDVCKCDRPKAGHFHGNDSFRYFENE